MQNRISTLPASLVVDGYFLNPLHLRVYFPEGYAPTEAVEAKLFFDDRAGTLLSSAYQPTVSYFQNGISVEFAKEQVGKIEAGQQGYIAWREILGNEVKITFVLNIARGGSLKTSQQTRTIYTGGLAIDVRIEADAGPVNQGFPLRLDYYLLQ